MPVDPHRLQELYVAAAELPSGEREPFLDRECAGDAELRQGVDALLRTQKGGPSGSASQAAGATGGYTPSLPDSATQLSEPHDDLDLPRENPIAGLYWLERRLGEGGMGEVWVAQQTEPVKRQVAIKLIRPGIGSRSIVARFEQERQALAVMDHPNIARVLDGGVTESGQPFFVMELVHGLPLTRYCDENRLTPRQRLELLVPICQAVQHAHQKGVVHRDLKPSNILVTTIDGRPVPKVIDFGVAKATAGKLAEELPTTQFGAVIGTLEYMSPEQASGGQDTDTRADVYSLGVVLYELLTGLRPIDARRLREAAMHEMVNILLQEEPSKPSTRLSTAEALPSLAAVRQIEPRKLMAMLRGELDWIVMKCLEKDRNRRYETANGLARDIQRYLTDEPVEARPPSAAYRFSKFLRRNKGKVLAASLVLLALVGGIVGTSIGLIQARRAQERAELAESETKKRADELQQVANYQDKMLDQFDATAAGVRLIRDLRARHGAALERSKVPEAERKTRAAAFEQELSAVNATDAAAELLDRTVLAPAVATLDKQFADQPLVDAALRTTLGGIYHTLGRREQSLKLYEKAYELRKKVLGENNRETLLAHGGIGKVLGELQRLAEADVALQATVAGLQQTLGDDATETLDARSLLAQEKYNEGKYDESEAISRDVLERRKRVQGPAHPDTLRARTSLGRYLMTRGRYDDAVRELREVAEGQRRSGDSTLDVTLANLGVALMRNRDFAGAEPILRESLTMKRRDHGEEHPDTLAGLANLASLLMDREKLAEAESLARELLEKTRRIDGSDHVETLKAMNIMGQVLYRLNRPKETEPYYREALERGRRVLGDDHPDTIVWIANYGFLMQRLGRIVEAEKLYREALERNRRQLGETHPYTLTMSKRLVEILRQQGKPGEAETTVRALHDQLKKAHGDDHPEALNQLSQLGSLLREQGKLDEAEPILRQAMEQSRRLHGEENEATLTAILRVGGLLVAQHKYAEAIAILAPIQDKVRKTFQGMTGTLRFASLQGLLGQAQTGLAKRPEEFTAAEKQLLEAQSTFARVRGDRDKETLDWTRALAEFYAAWDKAEPGKGYAEKAAEWKKKLVPHGQ